MEIESSIPAPGQSSATAKGEFDTKRLLQAPRVAVPIKWSQSVTLLPVCTTSWTPNPIPHISSPSTQRRGRNLPAPKVEQNHTLAVARLFCRRMQSRRPLERRRSEDYWPREPEQHIQ